jgi:hypothetical protein
MSHLNASRDIAIHLSRAYIDCLTVVAGAAVAAPERIMQQNGQGSLLIRLDGVFDTDAAVGIQDRIADADEGTEIYIDLSRVRDFHDRAVAVLADVIAATAARVSVRGLRQHQYRMMRYLGVPGAALDPGLATRQVAQQADL